VPATVQAVLAARIDRLGRREKAVIQAAAVIGKEFPRRSWKALSNSHRRSSRLRSPTTAETGGGGRTRQQTLEIAERTGSSFSRAWSWYLLGLAESLRGEWRFAIDAIERSRTIAKEHRTTVEADGVRRSGSSASSESIAWSRSGPM
jgi:hypothetical protein